MPNKPAPPLAVRDGDEDTLKQRIQSTTLRADWPNVPRIVLLAAEGMANAHIAEPVGTTTTLVWKWRTRYREAGIEPDLAQNLTSR